MSFCHSGFDSDDIRLHMDEKRFQQVLLNYQSNALKFIDKPEGRIEISLQLIRANGKHEEAVAWITS